jgi:hypothetical protein
MARTRRLAHTLVAVALCVVPPGAARAQESRLETGASVRDVARQGTSLVLETEGPALAGRREFYRPVPPLRLRYRWILVQDSTIGAVFTAPSGVRAGLDGYESDAHLRALRAIVAVELRALVFDVWGEPAGYLTATAPDERGAGERWQLRPRWRDPVAPGQSHRTSITWIHRVMFDDESVVEADLAAVGAAWSFVTGREFAGLPEQSPERAEGL